jgi:hypothetical protein
MKFDALIFEASWNGDLSVDTAMAQIREHFDESRLVRPHPDGSPAVKALPSHRNLRECGLDAMINRIEDCLARRVCHALPWYLGTTIVLARAGECLPFLKQMKIAHRGVLVGEYDNADTDQLSFRLAAFGDYDSEAEVCWDVARGDDDGVLVLCEFDDGDWWRPITALAQPVHAEVGDMNTVRVVYRVTDRDVLRGLWSRTSYDDGIARICAPGYVNAKQLIVMDGGRESDRSMLAFAKRHGWIYMQRYGGGSDEHYAVFAARKPELATSAYRYAETRAISDGGWWVSGML